MIYIVFYGWDVESKGQEVKKTKFPPRTIRLPRFCPVGQKLAKTKNLTAKTSFWELLLINNTRSERVLYKKTSLLAKTKIFAQHLIHTTQYLLML